MKYKKSKENKQRADRAGDVLTLYTKEVGGGTNDHATNFGDMLCDFMHLCAQKKIDFFQCVDDASRHFEVERKGQE